MSWNALGLDQTEVEGSTVAEDGNSRSTDAVGVEHGRVYLAAKRVVDVVLASSGILLLSPVIVAVCLLIKIDSRGPVLFKQTRVGLRRTRFEILKFRKMHADLPAQGSMLTKRGDARMTRVGRLLERTKLDELPQLVNVLRGDMSVVGPRPEVPEFVELYPQRWDEVLSMKPGIFGASQNHFRNEAELYPALEEDIEPFYVREILPVMLDLDTEYVRHAGLLRDMSILLRGVGVVVFK